MKIIRADPCGFCPGVKRALALAEQAMAGGTKVYTLGPLVHNEYVMTKLGSRGVEAIDRLDDIDPAALVIRAHGVSPATLTKAEALGFTIYDATCPRVRKVQQLATSLSAAAKTIILVGESEHPEVKGIVAHAQGPGKIIVVRNDKQIADLPELPQAVELLAQTTQTPANIQSVADALQNREVSVNMHDTICLATSQRQAAARELARCVDVMIVVGSNRSANTAV